VPAVLERLDLTLYDEVQYVSAEEFTTQVEPTDGYHSWRECFDSLEEQFADSYYQELVVSVRENGIRQPVAVVCVLDFPPQLYNGHHRVYLATALNIPLPVILRRECTIDDFRNETYPEERNL
jgi:hypothetical protein